MGTKPSTVRNVALKRRFRGYDRRQTETLLAQAVEGYEALRLENVSLSEQLVAAQSDHEKREYALRDELAELRRELDTSKQRVEELEGRLAQSEADGRSLQEQLDGAREEAERVRETHGRAQEDLHEERERAARLATREKALVEQIAMLTSQLEQEDSVERLPARGPAPERVDRAAMMLLRLDSALESLEHETRRRAELTLKKARERADEIVRSAETQRRRGEGEGETYDPVSALERVTEASSGEEAEQGNGGIGEASWTSRMTSERAGPWNDDDF
jgi:cell division septum initiation protein DivIVA